ncbi:MAG TPA: hypothetical protein DG753_12870 [Clostridium sp.]|nr:hypothetical protein [Clostridium sp.]
MNAKSQELLTLVSDIKFTITKLDPAKHQPLIDLLKEYTEKIEENHKNFKSLINPFISSVEKCISDNNMIVPDDVTVLIKSFSAFLPN